MIDRSFVDTNVWVYRVDRDEPHKQAAARRVLGAAAPGSLVVSTQVLAEFYVVTTRKLAQPLTPGEAREAVEALRALPTVGADADFLRSGIALSQKADLSLWDALIVQAAVASGCRRILTEDLQDGATINGIRIENPFRD
jgi:predicted nucleic acid-binding protein